MAALPHSTRRPKIGLATHGKWLLFRALEYLSGLRGNSAVGSLQVDPTAQPQLSMWVFASTIGELNAIDPLLRRLCAGHPQLRLVLITDHPHYRDTYRSRHPQAAICVTHGHSSDARTLARLYPPRLFVVAEIPCWPSDAPCRFSFALLLVARKHGAAAFLVNGWAYHQLPSCRMDAIERALFRRDHLKAFDLLCVQNDGVRRLLIAAGAPEGRIVVAGNLKFDAMQRTEWSVAQARSPRLLGALLDSGRTVVVAGCVTNVNEQQLVVDAFIALRVRHPDALLILVPRHPEVVARTMALLRLLDETGLPGCLRSAIDDAPLPVTVGCLVLDTIGELRDFYAAATVAHVGVNHNVLEPMAFSKPVTVTSGWEELFPSYAVYRTLIDERALLQADDAPELAAHWERAFHHQAAPSEDSTAKQVLERARGSTERHMVAIERALNGAQGGQQHPGGRSSSRLPSGL